MSTLQEFLLSNQPEGITEKVVISQRLKGKPFTICPMSGPEFNDYQKSATKIRKGKNVDFNSAIMRERVIINHTIEPNFKDPDFLKKGRLRNFGAIGKQGAVSWRDR